jgi:CheY-like chemotaxis protein
VLIADDEPSMRLLVHATIQSNDYTVYEASDGDQAWEMIQRHRPSLVLLDVQMPGMAGLQILRAIKENDSLAATHVILLLTSAQQSEIDAGLFAGADHLTKPFSPLDLLTKVEEALRL